MNDRSHTPSAPEDDRADEDERSSPQQSLSAWQVLTSTLAAAFGVQSSRNRERDFSRGKPVHFIIAGIVFTVLFVLTLIVLVNLIL